MKRVRLFIRYELIEGELLMTASPATLHQRISRKLEFELTSFVLVNDLGEVLDAPYEVYLDYENVAQPDILFISRERLDIISEKKDNLFQPYKIFSKDTVLESPSLKDLKIPLQGIF